MINAINGAGSEKIQSQVCQKRHFPTLVRNKTSLSSLNWMCQSQSLVLLTVGEVQLKEMMSKTSNANHQIKLTCLQRNSYDIQRFFS